MADKIFNRLFGDIPRSPPPAAMSAAMSAPRSPAATPILTQGMTFEEAVETARQMDDGQRERAKEIDANAPLNKKECSFNRGIKLCTNSKCKNKIHGISWGVLNFEIQERATANRLRKADKSARDGKPQRHILQQPGEPCEYAAKGICLHPKTCGGTHTDEQLADSGIRLEEMAARDCLGGIRCLGAEGCLFRHPTPAAMKEEAAAATAATAGFVAAVAAAAGPAASEPAAASWSAQVLAVTTDSL